MSAKESMHVFLKVDGAVDSLSAGLAGCTPTESLGMVAMNKASTNASLSFFVRTRCGGVKIGGAKRNGTYSQLRQWRCS